jgi:NAD(P)H-dependent flavin oxidoreductase YrpB (nitropropane dioxygenase family)
VSASPPHPDASAGRQSISDEAFFDPDPDTIVETARTARVVEFFYGDPTRAFIQAVHRGGSTAGWQVGSVDEARAAQDAGCDYVVAQESTPVVTCGVEGP